jgi:O-antigen/teichoic acid export membrane protein
MKRLLGSMAKLGAGEAVSKLAAFAFYGYISRAFGVELLGIVALSQTVAVYVMLGTDLGLRMIGARLVARDASAAPVIIRHVLRKRIISCVVCISLASIYALWGPVPAGARLYVLGFTLGMFPYAFSLDWLVWGFNHFGWLGAWRGGVGVLFASGAIAAIRASGATLLPITIANATSSVFGVGFLWALWRFRWQSPHSESKHENREMGDQFRWAVVLPLGAAMILNLMFNNFDTVMLGAMTSAAEVGRYNAAYKILLVICGGYYLLTQSLYPRLSRVRGGHRTRRLFLYALLGVSIVGGCITIVVGLWAAPILRAVYGSDMNAIHLLRLLSFAIPLDFCVALMTTVLVSRGFDKTVLWCVGSAALCDILLNLWLIPRHGATGAAWAAVMSYFILLVVFAKPCLRGSVFREDRTGPNTLETVSARA